MLDTPAWAVVKANVEHLEANVRALGISLTKEEIYDVDAALEFDPGFPVNFIFSEQEYHTDLTTANVTLVRAAAHVDTAPPQGPPVPRALILSNTVLYRCLS